MDKMENPIYDCTAYFCIITPSNECMLVDVNLDPHRDKAIDELNKMK